MGSLMDYGYGIIAALAHYPLRVNVKMETEKA